MTFKSFSQICDFSKFLFPNCDFTVSDFHVHMQVSVFDFGGNDDKSFWTFGFTEFDVLQWIFRRGFDGLRQKRQHVEALLWWAI